MTGPLPLLECPLQLLDGSESTLGEVLNGRAALAVNVASRCGLTPQYAALQALHEEFADREFTVLGFPCNQFGGQEPGTAEEIGEFCSTSYATTFPMAAKVDVNGRRAHPIWQELTTAPDATGRTGEVLWNFEKFLIDRSGQVVARFGPRTDPAADEVRTAVEKVLAP